MAYPLPDHILPMLEAQLGRKVTEEELRALAEDKEAPEFSRETRLFEFMTIDLSVSPASATLPADFRLIGLTGGIVDEPPKAYFFRQGMTTSELEATKIQMVLDDYNREAQALAEQRMMGSAEKSAVAEPADFLAFLRQKEDEIGDK